MAHWKLAQKYIEHIPFPLENLKTNINKATKILLLDGLHTKVRKKNICTHIAFDTGIGVIDYWNDCTENKQAYGYILARLAQAGYIPICIVSDGHWGIKALCEEEKIPQQKCIFHVLKDLKTQLEDNSELVGANKVLYSRLKGILKSSSIESLEEKVSSFRKHLILHFDKPRQRRVIDWFLRTLPNATTHLSFAENIPRTTALLENINGQIRARTKTFRGVKSEQSLNNLLKILFRFRNYK